MANVLLNAHASRTLEITEWTYFRELNSRPLHFRPKHDQIRSMRRYITYLKVTSLFILNIKCISIRIFINILKKSNMPYIKQIANPFITES